MSYHDHSHELTRIGVSCPPRNSTTASRRDTRGGRMQTESDATCFARVLPERPSPNHPPSFSLVLFLSPLFTSLCGSYQLVPDPRLIFICNAQMVRTEKRNLLSKLRILCQTSFFHLIFVTIDRILFNDTNHWYIKSESLLLNNCFSIYYISSIAFQILIK